MRIVSLLPSATETLFAIGAGDEVIAVTFECDAPPEARQRRIVSTSALPETVDGRPATPAEIDVAVREKLAAGEDLYHLDRDALSGLSPDLVVTQDLCAVCAVDVSEVHDALDYLGCSAQVLTSDPHTIAAILEGIRKLGQATGHADTANRLVAGLEQRLAALPGTPPPGAPRVAVLEWTDPPFAPGHWVPEMVTLAGGLGVLGTAGQKSVTISWEQVVASRPDILVAAPCGYRLDGSARLTEDLLGSGALEPLLRARVQVWAVDANASFARPGPRVVDGIEALAAIIDPALSAPDPAMARRLN